MVRIFGLDEASQDQFMDLSAEVILNPGAAEGDLAPNFSASSGYTGRSAGVSSYYDGDKFPGGFGETILYTPDYWELRERSNQLFTENLYARGIINRLVTNEINTGLMPDLAPIESVIGVQEDSLNDWIEDVENRYAIWAESPKNCDYLGRDTLGTIQRIIRNESLIEGDILVVLHQDAVTSLPKVQLVSGSNVRTPIDKVAQQGNEIYDGVEVDKNGRTVAHWIEKEDFTSERIPAFGAKTGRAISWLVYGSQRRCGVENTRGEPLLSIILQSLKEIDRYRDSAQRKAVINSILAMFIKKSADTLGTLPMTGGAVRKDSVNVDDGSGDTRQLDFASMIPGFVAQDLAVGEEPVLKGGDGTDINFPLFEGAVLSGIAWSLEMPPEILTLSFSSNYSASQAAINEWKFYLNKTWGWFGDQALTPIKDEWLLSEVLVGKIQATGFLEAWRDPTKYDVYGAWTFTQWYGTIKPSTDLLKQVKGSELLINNFLSTHAREARVTNGTKFRTNAKKIKKENEVMVDANQPIVEAEMQKTERRNAINGGPGEPAQE